MDKSVEDLLLETLKGQLLYNINKHANKKKNMTELRKIISSQTTKSFFF